MQNVRKRLIELIVNAPKIPILINGIASGKVYQTAEHIADHLLANGAIVPPFNIGDKVYLVDIEREIEEYIVAGICKYPKGIFIKIEYAGGLYDIPVDKVFLAREDAKRALKPSLPDDVSEKIMKHFTEVE